MASTLSPLLATTPTFPDGPQERSPLVRNEGPADDPGDPRREQLQRSVRDDLGGREVAAALRVPAVQRILVEHIVFVDHRRAGRVSLAWAMQLRTRLCTRVKEEHTETGTRETLM